MSLGQPCQGLLVSLFLLTLLNLNRGRTCGAPRGRTFCILLPCLIPFWSFGVTLVEVDDIGARVKEAVSIPQTKLTRLQPS